MSERATFRTCASLRRSHNQMRQPGLRKAGAFGAVPSAVDPATRHSDEGLAHANALNVRLHKIDRGVLERVLRELGK